jgi:hypothetical protein
MEFPDYVTSKQFTLAMNKVDRQFSAVEERLDNVETRYQELDNKIDRVTAQLLAAMPNKDDYVTRVEFNEFREQFNRLQDVVLRMDATIQTELVLRNRQFEKMQEDSERLRRASEKHENTLNVHQRAIELLVQIERRAEQQGIKIN